MRPTSAPSPVLAAASLVGLVALLSVGESDAYSVTGFSLGLDQRDQRVFDNFPLTSSGGGPPTHVNFPGASGPSLAIWKAAVEWGSGLHGDGDGDPHQPFDLGSGGANFDPAWQGAAPGVGPLDSNVHAAISGTLGGVLAYVESAPNGGWRVRYDASVNWWVGPGAAGQEVDLQGIATHMTGHLLGLGHSSVSGATMAATLSSVGTSARSLHPDDSAGAQAVYGLASPTKPVVVGLEQSGTLLTVVGLNFSSFGNEVWFTQANNLDGEPLVVGGLAATNGGTRIALTVAGEAAPGDVLVRRSGSGGASLSNAWPFDGPEPCVVPYGLGLGGANTALLSAATEPVLGTTLLLDLDGFTGQGLATLALAGGPASVPLFGGTLLVDPTGVTLLGATILTGSGTLSLPLPATPALAGARVWFQAAMADGGGPSGITLTNGLEVVLCP